MQLLDVAVGPNLDLGPVEGHTMARLGDPGCYLDSTTWTRPPGPAIDLCRLGPCTPACSIELVRTRR
ncbi:hypothetical protein CRV15_28120 [Streptomyces clavuligerus]|uniref:Uncharacterized protein n=1 Tax=Streptomyces clavuligerus TaxID=1901 RepID=B5H3D5_STRCL|nr:hypothetical protein D1794_28765 [Streptomyces clavuligerus]EDY53081.1 hypothetical protein SSCG_06135 [Streptomyces clavuligerus]EFG05081.1 Hypothetical protein SCLAV_0005 [Streptomyces clavuligerus]QCS09136.1 hypothetical protein CRV15_28120 [Streptomyces clavuligerus]QPJ91528.1 hypothetical protein GE265_00045 [Streptomyces clavuligerus]